MMNLAILIISGGLAVFSVVKAENKSSFTDSIFLQVQNDIASAKLAASQNEYLSRDTSYLIEEFFRNVSLYMKQIQSIEPSDLKSDSRRDPTAHMESKISSEIMDRIESMKESIMYTKKSVETLMETVAISVLSFENDTKRIYSNAWKEEIENMNKAVYLNQERKYDIKEQILQEILLTNSAKSHTFPESFYNKDVWQKAGYVFDDGTSVAFEQCKDLLQSISLQRFVSRPEVKRFNKLGGDFNGSIYIGASDWSSAINIFDASILRNSDPIVDGDTFFNCNLMVISAIADELDLIEARMGAAISSFDDLLKRYESIMKLYRDSKGNQTDTIIDMAIDIGLLEIETMTKRAQMEVASIIHAIELSAIKNKLDKNVEVSEIEVESLNHIAVIENMLKLRVNHDHYKSENFVDLAIEITSTLNEILWIQESTSRDIELLKHNMLLDIEHEVYKIKSYAQEERELESYSINKIKILGEEAKRSIVIVIETLSQHIFSALKFLVSSKGRRQVLFIILIAMVLSFFVSFSKESISFLLSFVIQRISMPRLVREWGRGRTSNKESVILCPTESRRVCDIIHQLKLRKKRNTPLRNVLLYGSPGMGKTMIARIIAESSCGLPYAIMSGADIAPLGSTGSSEFQKLILWASKQKHGGILVIDEAECALGRRIRNGKRNRHEMIENQNNPSSQHSTSSSARDALNVFLSLTGETSGRVMLILTTSNPGELDKAVLDRCDDLICCYAPSRIERQRIIQKEIESWFVYSHCCEMKKSIFRSYKKDKRPQLDPAFDVDQAVRDLSSDTRTGCMSGRDLSNIIRAVHSAVIEKDFPKLERDLWNKVTNEMVSSIKSMKELKKRSYGYCTTKV